LYITGIPSLSLKFEIDFLDLISVGFCHVIFIIFFSNSSKSFIDFLVAKDPIPIETITFSNLGTEFIFFTHNFSFKEGTTSLLNFFSALMYFKIKHNKII